MHFVVIMVRGSRKNTKQSHTQRRWRCWKYVLSI